MRQAFTIPCAMIGFFGGSFYFGSLQTDPTKPIMARLYLVVLEGTLKKFTGNRSHDVLWRMYHIVHGCAVRSLTRLGLSDRIPRLPGAGYVVGPSMGSAMWRIMNRKAVAQIDALDREFYRHVANNRVDASLQSATNPVPDYYGEPTFWPFLAFPLLIPHRRKSWVIKTIQAGTTCSPVLTLSNALASSGCETIENTSARRNFLRNNALCSTL